MLKNHAKRRRRLRCSRPAKAAFIAGLLLFAAATSSMVRTRPRPEPEITYVAVPSASEFGYAVGLAKISADLAEVRYFLEDYPAFARDVLVSAGVDPEEYCQRYPEFTEILLGDQGGVPNG